MRKILLAAVALFAGSFMSMAQEVKTLDDYSEVRFYGIDFAPVKVVAASETVSEFIDAFGKINNLFLTEPDKYIIALEDRLKKKIVYVDIDNVVNQISAIDESELKVNHTPKPLTEQDAEFELQDLDIKPAEGLGLVILAGELNKGTDYGTFYYVFFDNDTMKVLDVWPFKGKSGGIGLCNYWARAYYRTIAEINPTKFYQSKKKIKAGVTNGVNTVKEKIAGDSDEKKQQ